MSATGARDPGPPPCLWVDFKVRVALMGGAAVESRSDVWPQGLHPPRPGCISDPLTMDSVYTVRVRWSYLWGWSVWEADGRADLRAVVDNEIRLDVVDDESPSALNDAVLLHLWSHYSAAKIPVSNGH